MFKQVYKKEAHELTSNVKYERLSGKFKRPMATITSPDSAPLPSLAEMRLYNLSQ
jgi:hypothetical protein